MSANTLLISPKMLKDRSGMYDNGDEKILKIAIKTAQDMYIHPVLGTDLFEKIQEDISTGSIAGVYKSLLDSFVVDALVWYSVYNAATDLSFQLANKGLIRKGGENIENASMSDLVDISNHYKGKAEFYSERLIHHLKAKYDLYKDYLKNTDCDDLRPDNSGYTCPVVLD